MKNMTDEEGEIKGVPSHQFAYRRGHGCINAVDLLKEEAMANMRKMEITGI